MAKKLKHAKQRTYKVRVTKQDIENGEPNSAAYCPIALAVSRVTGDEDVEVEPDVMRLDDDNGNYTELALPKKLSTFIDRFDAGKAVKPFAFEVTLPVTLSGSVRA